MRANTMIRTPTARAAALFCRPEIPQHKVEWSRLVQLDFETYYDANYTLKKMSTSEYIRDPRFKVQMMGIKIGNGPTRIVHPSRIKLVLASINWNTHALLAHNTQFDGFILSHHYGIHPCFLYDTLAMARGLHSNEIGGGLDEVSRFYGGAGKHEGVLDETLGVKVWSKELFAKVSPYCVNDVNEMARVFRLMVLQLPDDEFGNIDWITRCFTSPVLKVDMPRVEVELKRELANRERLMYAVVDPDRYDVGGDLYDYDVWMKLLNKRERQLEGVERGMLIIKRVIGSNEMFAALLRDEGIEPPIKISAAWMKLDKDAQENYTGKKFTYAFAKDDIAFTNLPNDVEEWEFDREDPEQLKQIIAKQERLQALVDARIAVKSTTNITRAERFLKAGANDWSLPCGYAYSRAHTHRLGGNNKMNMQNLKRGGELRESILAPPGHVISVCDSGQIEARVNGWLWGQDDLLLSFEAADKWLKSMGVAQGDDRDAYCKFASLIYGRHITTEDSLERFVGKVCVLGLGFGMGAQKLQMTLAKGALGGKPVYFSLAKCYEIVNTYRRVNYKIEGGWRICSQIIEDMASGREGSHGPLNWEKGKIWLPNGMALLYPDLKKTIDENGWDAWTYQSGKMRKKIYGGLLCENIVQALARIIVIGQTLTISRKYRVVMTTHDEAAALAKTAQGQKCYDFMAKALRTPPSWCADIPLNCEGGFAANYSK